MREMFLGSASSSSSDLGRQAMFHPQSPERTSFPPVGPSASSSPLVVRRRPRLLQVLFERVCTAVPLSLALEALRHTASTTGRTGLAVGVIGRRGLRGGIQAVAARCDDVWRYVLALRSSDLFLFLVSLQRRAVKGAAVTYGYFSDVTTRRWTEAAVAVESGKKSASIAIHYLAGTASYKNGRRSSDPSASRSGMGQADLLRRLDRINRTCTVVSYEERDETLTRNAKRRVMKMMHYQVSLKPFVAKVKAARGASARRGGR